MRKYLTIGLYVFMLFAAIMMQGCKKEQYALSTYKGIDNTKKDTLRLFNLLKDISDYPDYAGYAFYLNDSLVKYEAMGEQYATAYGVPPQVGIPAQGGQFNMKLVRYAYYTDTPKLNHPDPARVLFEKSVTLPPHSGYNTVVFYDNAGKPDLKFIPLNTTDAGAPGPGKFKIRVVNFGYDMADTGPSYPDNSTGEKFTMDLQYADSTSVPGNTNLAFGTIGQYKEIDYGIHQFLVNNVSRQQYLTNSGDMNDIMKVFGVAPKQQYSFGDNYLFPNVLVDYYNQNSTVQYGNIGTYSFSAGGCYTVYVIGSIYSVTLDRMYNVGTLDNFGKVQVVNTNQNQQDMSVKITHAGGEINIPSLAFGKYTTTYTVPAGNVKITFSAQGKELYSYDTQVIRLANSTYYYNSDLKNIPFVFAVPNTLPLNDFVKAQYGPNTVQLSKIGSINLSADAGPVFYTRQDPMFNNAEKTMGGDITYKIAGTSKASFDGVMTSPAFSLRLSASRKDTLAAKLVTTLTHPFPRLPAPGNYTLVTAGLLNTIDPAKKLRLIMVKHTNFVEKN